MQSCAVMCSRWQSCAVHSHAHNGRTCAGGEHDEGVCVCAGGGEYDECVCVLILLLLPHYLTTILYTYMYLA